MAKNSKSSDFRTELTRLNLSEKIGFPKKMRLDEILKLCQASQDQKQEKITLISYFISSDVEFHLKAYENGPSNLLTERTHHNPYACSLAVEHH